MTIRERILTIRLLNSLDNHPEYADCILEDEDVRVYSAKFKPK